MAQWVAAINQALHRVPDMDWNYSRIELTLVSLHETVVPYVLEIDWLDVRGRTGEAAYRASLDEITWGQRHSHELGILEIASLRLNRALAEATSAAYWHDVRPVIRLQKRTDLLEKDRTHAFWYRVEELQGEEFENR